MHAPTRTCAGSARPPRQAVWMRVGLWALAQLTHPGERTAADAGRSLGLCEVVCRDAVF